MSKNTEYLSGVKNDLEKRFSMNDIRVSSYDAQLGLNALMANMRPIPCNTYGAARFELPSPYTPDMSMTEHLLEYNVHTLKSQDVSIFPFEKGFMVGKNGLYKIKAYIKTSGSMEVYQPDYAKIELFKNGTKVSTLDIKLLKRSCIETGGCTLYDGYWVLKGNDYLLIENKFKDYFDIRFSYNSQVSFDREVTHEGYLNIQYINDKTMVN
jgi:hypothetical protein